MTRTRSKPLEIGATLSFRGNKAGLPSKICVSCGRPMTWRRRWAKDWEQVKYCSDACRRNKPAKDPG